MDEITGLEAHVEIADASERFAADRQNAFKVYACERMRRRGGSISLAWIERVVADFKRWEIVCARTDADKVTA
jgi:hypothetical protein